MRNRPLLVGITGGIGSGKSVVCNIFDLLGVPIYHADECAKLLLNKDQEVIDSIKVSFGEKAYLSNGEVDRQFLANHVFSDPKKLKIINSIVHPAVARDFEEWCLKKQKHLYLIKEAALLVETGSYQCLDFLVTVTAPVDLRVSRVLARDQHRTKEQVLQIISNQSSEEEKTSRSKFILLNDNHTLVIPQVLEIHNFFNNYVQAG